MDGAPGASPSAHGGARCRQAPAADGHALALGVGTGAMVVGHVDDPAARGGGACRRHVATEVDERGGARRHGDAPRGAVGGQRLGRRPEIQAALGAQPQQPPLRVQRHAAPSRGRYPAHVVRCVGVHRREVAVIAQGDERRGDGGVDGALGLLRGAQRDAHGLREQPARRRQAPGRVVGAHQLRIGAEAAAGAVDGVELGRQQALGLAHGGLVDHDDRGGADRLQGRRGVGRAHDPPEVTGGGGGACWMAGACCGGAGGGCGGGVVVVACCCVVVGAADASSDFRCRRSWWRARVARRRAPRRLRVGAARDLGRRLRGPRLGRRRERAHARHGEHRHRRDDGRHAAQSPQGAIAMGDVVADERTRPSSRRGHRTTFGSEGRCNLRNA